MRLLLDTHILIDLVQGKNLGLKPDRAALITESSPSVSVASLWEIAIKVRLGRLPMSTPLAELDRRIDEFGCTLVPVSASHATAEVDPWPDTNDPFDRLLLAVCAVEDLRLVTRDAKLVGHPLAWRPASA